MRKSLGNLGVEDILALKKQAKSRIKFDTILEALELVKYIGHPNLDNGQFKGWKYVGEGMYKTCFFKNSIVIKFPNQVHRHPGSNIEILREYDQWKNPPDAQFKKYLTSTYALVNEQVLIQDRVLYPCDKVFNTHTGLMECTKHKELWNLSTHYNLQDFQNNHGHTKQGNIKFFDSVWRRARGVE